MITIDKSLSVRKRELLIYFRERAGESLEEIRRTYVSKQFKKQAKAINKAISETRKNVEKVLLQKAAKEK